MSSNEVATLPVDERSCRREGFREGHWVELADGQRYCLPPVLLRIFADEKDDGAVGDVLCRPWYADDLEKDVDTLFGVGDPDFMSVWRSRINIAMRLLKSNYNLPAGIASRLLSYIPGDPESERRWEKIRSAMMGRNPDEDVEADDPKAVADTSAGSD